MSTIKTTYIQHPSAASPNIELAADGTVVLPLSNLEDLNNVSATPTDGQALVWDDGTSQWVAETVTPTSLDASVIDSGTLDSARISGSYTGITGTGALNAGSITSGFGNIDIGTSTFSGAGSHRTVVRFTASNGSYSIPADARKPGVRVTVIGGGGGGGGQSGGAGGTGGTSTFNPNNASAISASGGAGTPGTQVTNGFVGTAGFASANGGGAATDNGNSSEMGSGRGGAIVVAYIDLTTSTSAAVTVGAGGAGGTIGGAAGGAGGRGEVILEY